MLLDRDRTQEGLSPAILQNEKGVYGKLPPPTPTDTGGYQLPTPEPAPVPNGPSPTGVEAYTGGPVNAVSSLPSSPSDTKPTNIEPAGAGFLPNPIEPRAPGGVAPGGVTPAVPAPTAAVPPPPPPGTTALTGKESPFSVMPQNDPNVAALMSRLQQESFRQLDQPTVYDDALFGKMKETSARGINDNFDAAQEHLNSELADRGINYSTIAGGRHANLATGRANALSDLDTSLLRERAMSLAQGRTAAFNNARSVTGDTDSMGRADRAEIRGERGYVDDLRTTARDQALQETLLGEQYGRQSDQDFQSLIDRMYGYGTDTRGSSLLSNAAGSYGGAADRYTDQQIAADNGIADLAQWASQFLAGR